MGSVACTIGDHWPGLHYAAVSPNANFCSNYRSRFVNDYPDSSRCYKDGCTGWVDTCSSNNGAYSHTDSYTCSHSHSTPTDA